MTIDYFLKMGEYIKKTKILLDVEEKVLVVLKLKAEKLIFLKR